jgi:hypothetical protein
MIVVTAIILRLEDDDSNSSYLQDKFENGSAWGFDVVVVLKSPMPASFVICGSFLIFRHLELSILVLFNQSIHLRRSGLVA